jgi:hypothetical protein
MNNQNNINNKISFPYIKINIFYLIAVILFLIIIYLLYLYLRKKYATSFIEYTQNLLVDKKNGKDAIVINNDKTPVSLYSDEYNISFWIKVFSYNYNYGAIKYIIKKGDMEIYLHPKNNNLHMKISSDIPTTELSTTTTADLSTTTTADLSTTTTADLSTTTTADLSTTTTESFININNYENINNLNISNNEVDYKHNELLDKVLSQYEKINDNKYDVELYTDIKDDECILFDLPLQKWTHVSINYYSNNIDIYMDGKLSSSCKLNIIPVINLRNMIITPNGGFDGELSNIIYTNIKLSNKQINKLYKKGPE